MRRDDEEDCADASSGMTDGGAPALPSPAEAILDTDRCQEGVALVGSYPNPDSL